MELEDTPMTFFDPIWPTDASTHVQMEKNRQPEQLIAECLRVRS